MKIFGLYGQTYYSGWTYCFLLFFTYIVIVTSFRFPGSCCGPSSCGGCGSGCSGGSSSCSCCYYSWSHFSCCYRNGWRYGWWWRSCQHPTLLYTWYFWTYHVFGIGGKWNRLHLNLELVILLFTNMRHIMHYNNYQRIVYTIYWYNLTS